MRRLAPLLTVLVLAAGLYLVFEQTALPLRRGVAPAQKLIADATSRPAESRPESRPELITAASYAESAPASRTESGPASAPYKEVVLVQLLREDERPISGATIEAAFGDVTMTARTDGDGKAEIEAHPGVSAMLRTWGRDFCLHEERVPLDSGKLRVVVPNGERVAGRVNVGGRVPEEPIWIGLTGHTRLCRSSIPGPGTEHETTTDAAGRFEFFNLPPGWKGTLSVNAAYAIADKINSDLHDYVDIYDSRTLSLDAPNVALEVGLLEHPTIKGRIVRHGSHEPVQGTVYATFEVGSESYVVYQLADADGRFRLWPRTDVTHLTLALSDGAELGTRTIDLQGPLDSLRNLGDIELAAVMQIRFQVHDAKGEPVAGAVGAVTATRSVSDPTDAEGRASVSVDQSQRELRVGKLGYATATVRVPADTSNVLPVELAAGNKLTLEIRLADGSIPPVDQLRVKMVSLQPIFATESGMVDELFWRTGATSAYEETEGQHERSIAFSPDDDGRVIMGGFRPGAELNVEVRGVVLNELVEERFVVMGAQDQKTVAIRTTRMPGKLVGRVHAVNGDPVDGADVTTFVHGDRSSSYGTSTDHDGRFEIEGIFAFVLDLRVVHDGFVPLNRGDVPLPAPGAELDFTLIPCRQVVVSVVDERGRPLLDKADVFAYVEGSLAEDDHYIVSSLGNGSYLVENAAPKIIVINVNVGTTQVHARHDARVGAIRLVVPTDGAAEVHWWRLAGDPTHCRFRVESVAGVLTLEGDIPPEVTDHYLDASPLPPGRYLITIDGFDEQAGEWVPIASSGVFDVIAHEAAFVEMTR